MYFANPRGEQVKQTYGWGLVRPGCPVEADYLHTLRGNDDLDLGLLVLLHTILRRMRREKVKGGGLFF